MQLLNGLMQTPKRSAAKRMGNGKEIVEPDSGLRLLTAEWSLQSEVEPESDFSLLQQIQSHCSEVIKLHKKIKYGSG